ncbi:hypothetical protein NPIL_562201 [Nephila pilipes]|uniref:Uncharacterized protein n=1 Tax=Nephila pilipes TaxID=299642 RepID=A0A8X6TEY3_NEPPI|nr:hypothetical protein NPIL_562201 [Nephila pilipes]
MRSSWIFITLHNQAQMLITRTVAKEVSLRPPDIYATWSQWWSELPLLSEIMILRMILDSRAGDSSVIQIHTFSDASQRAWSLHLLRVQHKDRISIALVTLKAVLHL